MSGMFSRWDECECGWRAGSWKKVASTLRVLSLVTRSVTTTFSRSRDPARHLRLPRDLREDVALAHDLDFFAADLDLVAGVAAVEHLVADGHRHRLALAVLEGLARADGHDLAALGLL